MRAAVVSDTHGNTVFMDRVLDFILNTHKADILLHLGDSYTDGARMLKTAGLDGAIVPGIYCDEYQDSIIPNACMQICGDWSVMLVHALKDYPGAGSEVNIVFYGHTHVPDFENRGGVYFINPGHLKEEVSKGQAPTYGILEIGIPEPVFEWYHPFESPVLCRQECLL